MSGLVWKWQTPNGDGVWAFGGSNQGAQPSLLAISSTLTSSGLRLLMSVGLTGWWCRVGDLPEIAQPQADVPPEHRYRSAKPNDIGSRCDYRDTDEQPWYEDGTLICFSIRKCDPFIVMDSQGFAANYSQVRIHDTEQQVSDDCCCSPCDCDMDEVNIELNIVADEAGGESIDNPLEGLAEFVFNNITKSIKEEKRWKPAFGDQVIVNRPGDPNDGTHGRVIIEIAGRALVECEGGHIFARTDMLKPV